MKKCAVYITADPFSFGHLDLIKRSTSIFDEVIVFLARVVSKKPCMLSYSDREDIVRHDLDENGLSHIKIVPLDGAVASQMKRLGINVLALGARDHCDFEEAHLLSTVNKMIDPSIETLVLPTRPEFLHVSSYAIRRLVKLGQNPLEMCSEYAYLKTKMNQLVKIGLTGNIGADFKTVQNVFSANGYEVFDIDKIQEDLYTDKAFIEEASSRFESCKWIRSGKIDQNSLTRECISNLDFKLEFESFLRTKLHVKFIDFIKDSSSSKILVSMSLMNEYGMDSYFDKTICIVTSEGTQFERLVKDYGLTLSEANDKMQIELQMKDKARRSNYVLLDDEDLESSTLKLINGKLSKIF